MRRLSALLLLVVLAAPALAECAGWSAVAAGRDACCARGEGAQPALTNCCGMSQQSGDVTAPDIQAARTGLKLLNTGFSPLAPLPAPARPLPTNDHDLTAAAPVPIYLQQSTLLI